MGAEPFLSWAGGKRKLLDRILPHVPEFDGRYYEPFMGGASMFFALNPKEAVLSDSNENLVETFQCVRDDVEAVIAKLASWEYSSAQYYEVRDSYRPRSPSGRAARFIYLNKTCWNGLYRENLSGKFNVPFGRRKNPEFLDRARLRAASAALEATTLAACDFEAAVKEANRGDLVFFDPPYVTGHNNNGFVEYNAHLFTWEDQERLARVATSLTARGVHVVITNAHHQAVLDLYPHFDAVTLNRHSTLAGDVSRRRKCREVLIVGGN